MIQDRKYIAGTYYQRDDRSGFKVRSFDTRLEWNGLIIRDDMSESRNQQDFVRGVYDDQRVEEPRPTPTAGLLGPLTTTTTAAANAGATSISVASSVRWLIGDSVEILAGTLDGASQFRTTLANVPNATTIVLASGLPQPTPSGNLVTNLTVQAVVDPSDFPASNGS